MATNIVRFHVAWWLSPYLYTLAAFCTITGYAPDWAKVKRVIDRAVTIKSAP